MKRRTFDLLVSIAGLALAVTLVVAGLVFRANADFAKDNVRQQLTAQKISFPPATALSDEEKQQPGVVKYAGQQVKTGDQARVYANEFIALHLAASTGGKTYSQLSSESRADPQDQALKDQVQTAFRGETLRGLLLTTYAFWTLGEKAAQASAVMLFGALVLLALSAAGLWHYSQTTKRAQLSL
jgi:hypothetical protein